MSTQLISSGAVLVEESTREKVEDLVRETHDRRIMATKIVLDDGAELALDRDLSDLVRAVLLGLRQGDLTIRSTPDELTSTSAAAMLGISRPTIMKLVADGELRSHRVGSHHRFLLSDVLVLREARTQKQREAFEALRALDSELGIDD